jgi:hypothetical protein
MIKQNVTLPWKSLYSSGTFLNNHRNVVQSRYIFGNYCMKNHHAERIKHWGYQHTAHNILFARCEALKVAKISMLVFWVVTLCRLADRYQHFGGTYCLHLQPCITTRKT